MKNSLQSKFESRRRLGERGFTLMEILVAVFIIVMFSTVVGVNVIGKLKEARINAAKVQMASLQQALQSYYLAHSMFPHTSQGLAALVSKPTVGKVPDNYPPEGYLGKKEVPKDPWGTDYLYECEDYQNYSLSSAGPDKEPGTDDDVKAE